MEFTILGPTELRIDGRLIPLGTAKQRGLLATLLYHAGDPVQVTTVVELLWPGRDPDTCRNLLYTLASRLRATLRTAGIPEALTRMPGVSAYRLDIEPIQVDYHRFRRLAAQARRAADLDQHDRCTALLTTALQLWRNNPLAELRGARSEHLRRDIREQLLTAEKLLAGSELATGHHDRALARLEPLIADNQFDETLARLQASALHSAGRTHDAREFIAAFRRRYRRKMRIEPHLNLVEILPIPAPKTHTVRAGADETAPVPRQLPYDVFDFTGHADLLSELDTLATDSGTPNVIAITGMPGVGKTAFATRWGHHRRDWFPDGQLYLNAEAHSQVPPVHPDDAVRRFLAGLGVPADRMPTDPVHRSALYHRLLSDRRLLVVLDNVLDSDQAQHLIPPSPTSLVIVISRNRLSGLSVRHGVRSLTITPLPHADRHGLLTRIIGPHRADAEPAAVHKLAQLSGGLPIALRIIGEHVASQPKTPLGDLADELGERLLDIDGDDSKELTIGTVFAWSVNALAPLPARLFRSLGQFPGATVAVEAASALLAADPVLTERALVGLARAHLIHHDAVGRYRMHDLLRLYAIDRDRLEGLPEERHAAFHRLLDWYLLTAVNAVRWLEPQRPAVPDLPEPTRVRPLVFPSEGDALRWCEVERTNLLSVIRAASREGFPRHAWQIVDTLHEVYDRSGPQGELRNMLSLALDAATADGHLLGCAGTLANLGAVHFASHDYQHAGELFTSALDLAVENGFAEIELACLHNLASVHLRLGRITTAIDVFNQVLDACRAAGNLAGEASTLYHLADAHRQLDEPDRARRLYHEALTICEQIGSLRGRSLNHVRLAELNAQTGQPEAALSHAQVALEQHPRVKDDVLRCDALIVAAEARLHLGQHRHCLSEATLARAVSEGLADTLREARSLVVLAEALVAKGNHRTARAHCREALDLLNNTGEHNHLAVKNRLLAVAAVTARG
ncbi:AfsR/SARP family transcriptional regulator [Micromonospora lutea]|uniref:SARP family transcriptional regulator n=1 Tax=Micromonospora lutea TaxID=419825 RepID=A0ABQ4IZ53_9ACTN|nr:tetratricopeptide repeat protein [Micromonospora lutea]GIJ23028.1 SARP family transcriptional regulator [Micromonospora lutea]